MKTDEIEFLKAVAKVSSSAEIRDLIGERDLEGIMNYKRAHYLLGKWTDKDLYEYGVSLDLGWLTQKGKDLAASLE